ncbi:MAG: PTS sugar transporter subunit IIA [Candidatus Omnitrophica bacterium]|nr:PTS sugar transporter subunit IIA [Candidatus Omnitrophota bacterium]
MNGFNTDNPILALSILFVVGYPAGLLARKIGIPKVTGNILAGVLLGPSLFMVFDDSAAKTLKPLTVFAMGMITCVVGGHLSYRRLHNALKRIGSFAIAEVAMTFTLVASGIYWFTESLPTALLMGAIATETAPATVLAVVREEKAKGLLIKTLLAVVALDNVLCILIFSLIKAQVTHFLASGEMAILTAMVVACKGLLFSILIGSGVGALLVYLVRKKKIEPFSGLFMAILLSISAAEILHASPLLTSLTLGIFLGNSGRDGESLVTSLESLEPVLMTCFFTLAGVDIHLDSLGKFGAIGAAYLVARFVGKVSGGAIGGFLGTDIARIRSNIGPALLSHAGLAIGLVVLLQGDPDLAAANPKMIEDITNVVLASIVIFEILGPPLVRRSVTRAGEAGKDRERIVKFIQEEYIVTPLEAEDKWDAIRQLAAFLIKTHGIKDLTVEDLIESIEEREKSISTAMGSGVAIPHAKLPASGPDIMGVMGICPAGIDFDAPDHRPVHYIIMIATPKAHQDRHLQVMAAVARMISNADIRAKLLTAQTPAEVYEVIEVEPSENYNYFLED